MIVGGISKIDPSLIPEKGSGLAATKYPFSTMEPGDVILVSVGSDDNDADMTLTQLKKRVQTAVSAFNSRTKKAGYEAKDFAIWIEEKKNGVMVAVRGNAASQDAAAAAVEKEKRSHKKKVLTGSDMAATE